MELKLVSDTYTGYQKAMFESGFKEQAKLTTRQWVEKFDAAFVTVAVNSTITAISVKEAYEKVIEQMREAAK